MSKLYRKKPVELTTPNEREGRCDTSCDCVERRLLETMPTKGEK